MFQLANQYIYWKQVFWLTQLQLCGNVSTAHRIPPTSFKVILYNTFVPFRKLFVVILIEPIWNFVLLMFSSVCRIVHSFHRGVHLFARSSSCCFHLQMLLFLQIHHLLNVAFSRELKISVWADRNFNKVQQFFWIEHRQAFLVLSEMSSCLLWSCRIISLFHLFSSCMLHTFLLHHAPREFVHNLLFYTYKLQAS